MSSLKIIAIALCLFCAMNARGQADDPRYKVSTGFDYSVGDYGDTEIRRTRRSTTSPFQPATRSSRGPRK